MTQEERRQIVSDLRTVSQKRCEKNGALQEIQQRKEQFNEFERIAKKPIKADLTEVEIGRIIDEQGKYKEFITKNPSYEVYRKKGISDTLLTVGFCGGINAAIVALCYFIGWKIAAIVLALPFIFWLGCMIIGLKESSYEHYQKAIAGLKYTDEHTARKDIEAAKKDRSREQKEVAMAKERYQSEKAKHNEKIAKLKELVEDCDLVQKRIIQQYEIPQSFQHDEALAYIAKCFENQTVDSFKEAYGKLEAHTEREQWKASQRAEQAIHNMRMQWQYEDEKRQRDQEYAYLQGQLDREREEARRSRERQEAYARDQADAAKRAAEEAERIRRNLEG